MEYNFPRYLASKKSVDDRALNEGVWRRLQAEMDAFQTAAPLRILEVGAGTGTMLERMLERGLIKKADYTGIDQQDEYIATARRRLPEWARRRAWEVTERPGELLLRQGARGILACFEAQDVDALIRGQTGRRQWDLLVAHAFLDLFDIRLLLPRLVGLMAAGGLAYLTINFDGVTILEPTIDPAFDQEVIGRYHQTMDERITAGKLSGDSQAGRHLFGSLAAAGLKLLEAGSSDWVVFSQDGRYPADEAYFLHFILHFIEESLGGQPGLDAVRFSRWLALRRAQVERGELVLIAHQLDFLAQAPIRKSAQ
jgi:SAM-dependent methyltransferase